MPLVCTYGVMNFQIINFIRFIYFPRVFFALLVIPSIRLLFTIIKITVLFHIYSIFSGSKQFN